MKKLLAITLLLISATCFAQTTTTLPLALRMDLVTWIKLDSMDYLAGGKVGILEIKVRNYDVYQVGTSGQYYVNVTNSMGVTSRKYLGYKITGGIQEYQKNSIFYNADTTKCWIWTVDRYGQLYKMDLPD